LGIEHIVLSITWDTNAFDLGVNYLDVVSEILAVHGIRKFLNRLPISKISITKNVERLFCSVVDCRGAASLDLSRLG
jgi:hypothetical protein